MYYKRKGFPEEGELVFCTVTKVRYNSVFCNIEEYRRTGLIHISEISPGRIRNIRDYVQEGKKIVCKVIDIDEDKGHIDLSLRRVTEIEKRKKITARKQESKAEKIIKQVAKRADEKQRKVYKKISTPLLKEYLYVHQAFQDVVENGKDVVDLGVPEKYADTLHELVEEKIKPRSVSISGELAIKTWDENGLQTVKDALKTAKQQGKKIEIRYLGSGRYEVNVEAREYKEAEKDMEKALDKAKEVIQKSGEYEYEFERKER